MTTQDNETRAERAAHALEAYAGDEYQYDTDEAFLGDLLTDLMHYKGTETFEAALRTARMHYEAELTGKE
jgi:hypothetical protein